MPHIYWIAFFHPRAVLEASFNWEEIIFFFWDKTNVEFIHQPKQHTCDEDVELGSGVDNNVDDDEADDDDNVDDDDDDDGVDSVNTPGTMP